MKSEFVQNQLVEGFTLSQLGFYQHLPSLCVKQSCNGMILPSGKNLHRPATCTGQQQLGSSQEESPVGGRSGP